jgi:bicarbonate transport system ATP-binding protein
MISVVFLVIYRYFQMRNFVDISRVDKEFKLMNGGSYIALKGIDLEVRQGEFISLIGHSGCGKSTLLNIIAGLDGATDGVVLVDDTPVTRPGPDRMVVFQNYSLLPWLTVRENIALAVNKVLQGLPVSEKNDIIEQHIDMVGLRAAADKKPGQLSGGMKQRVSIARALAIKPKVLLLDEPFGALDALTRGGLQTRLMEICQANQVTAVMVTHDIDEALLLSDRIIMLTNGPESKIGQILEVDIPRPRQRLEVVEHPSYYSLRSEMIYFLNQQKRVKKLRSQKSTVVARHGLEKVNLQLGFVPLSACAPLAIAQAKGLFAKHGLDEVSLVRESSWRGIVDGITGGYIDAAQMPSGMPAWLTLGGNQDRPLPIVTALTMARNGNAITLNETFYQQNIRTLDDFHEFILRTPNKRHNFGMVHPSSMHNLLLRYWLAAGGIDPDKDVNLMTIPPAQMVVDLKAGSIDGYCVGEPWNYRAAKDGVGFTIASDLGIWNGHPGKVLGVREDWANAYPNTHIALVKALLEACQYCADPQNVEEIRQLLSQKEYLGMKAEYITFADPHQSSDTYDPHKEQAHPEFFGNGINRPSRTEQLWIITQMARWGITPFPRNWVEILERVCRIGSFSTAARELGLDINYQRTGVELFDGVKFNAEDPIGYLNSLKIKRPISVAEIILDRAKS